jgi:hypothetical protein
VLFGLSAGAVELLADRWLVAIGTLCYPDAGPFLLDSPAYMPVAWLGMLSAGLALGIALRRSWSLPASSALVAAALGLYIPVYELLARWAGWWRYEHPTLWLGAVPPPIVVGEALLALPLVWMAERLARARLPAATALGAVEGLWIFGSYRLAWLFSGGW